MAHIAEAKVEQSFMASHTPYGPLPQGPGAYNRIVYHDDLLRIGPFAAAPGKISFTTTPRPRAVETSDFFKP